jgi:protein TonB
MTRKLLPLLCLCLAYSFIARSQDTLLPLAVVESPGGKGLVDENTTFSRVEIEAEFPGGLPAWKAYLMKNLNAAVPLKKNAPTGRYQVMIRFIVAKDGSISGITPETHHGYGMEEEVVRIIKKGPKWKPAVQNGKLVNAYRRQPVTFVVSGK